MGNKHVLLQYDYKYYIVKDEEKYNTTMALISCPNFCNIDTVKDILCRKNCEKTHEIIIESIKNLTIEIH
jgi:hypothetical protein